MQKCQLKLTLFLNIASYIRVITFTKFFNATQSFVIPLIPLFCSCLEFILVLEVLLTVSFQTGKRSHTPRSWEFLESTFSRNCLVSMSTKLIIKENIYNLQAFMHFKIHKNYNCKIAPSGLDPDFFLIKPRVC